MTRMRTTRFLAATALTALGLSACATPVASVPAMVSDVATTAPLSAPLSAPIDPSLPTQLPRTAVPTHYALSIVPDAPRLAFDGQVLIDVDVLKPTDRLVLNANQLAFKSVAIRGRDSRNRPGTATTDEAAQTATLAFGETLEPGRYQLDLTYSGKIQTQANGLFALDYKAVDGSDKRALYTQFEAPDARRFVPSWDEPIYKATWDLTATVPAGQMAVSNMPAANNEKLADGRSRVTFQTSPKMSSYLLFFSAGEFGRITRQVGNTEVGIVATRGNEEKSRLALDAEAQILPYFNDYFGTPYPLPKLDNVAAPGQSQFFGAMENWGSILTFESILLNDPAITTEAQRHAIFQVEAHEMAHQWFGNLVTMAWWDDLWLNEGFASWLENRTTHHFHPDWGADIDQVGSRERAMSLDSLVTTHPVVQNIRTVEQTNQAFDAITYLKGQSVISMLEGYAGSEVWKQGIRAYMAKHKYGNTRTDDLWRAIESANAAGLTRIAHDFTLQPGVPMVSVTDSNCVGGETHLSLAQGQFAIDRKMGSFTPLSWHVPVNARTIGGPVVRAVTDGPAMQMRLPGCGPVILNAGQTGYYRTLYRAADIAALKANFAKLGTVDQYGLIADNYAISFAGYQPMGSALDLVNVAPLNASPKLAEIVLGSWSQLYATFDNEPATQRRIGRIIGKRFGPLLDQIGLVPKAGEAPMITLLRPQLIGALGRAGDARVKAEAARLFANPAAIPGSLKTTWLRVIARDADAATWDRLRVMARNANSATERSALYQNLGTVADPALSRRALALALTDEPGATVSPGIIGEVASRDPEMALDFVLANLAQVSKLVDQSSQTTFIPRLASSGNSQSLVDKLERYARANIAEADRKSVNEALAAIRTRMAVTPRVRAETKAWLAANRL